MRLNISVWVYLLFSSMAFGQFDTLRIELEIMSIKDRDDHLKFWDNIYELDQKYRGSQTVDSIDFDNLLRVCMYFNRFGYPEKNWAGEKCHIISYVWIHNPTPKVSQYAFPIVFNGYLNKIFEDKTLRSYFLRVPYNRKYADNKHLSDPLGEVLKKLEMNISPRIDIQLLIETQKEEQAFLKANHKVLGIWRGETRYDTLYYQGKPIVNTYEDSPKRIFQDQKGAFHFQKIYDDGSYFPRQLFKDNNEKLRFFKNSLDYYVILANGTLKYVDDKGDSFNYKPEKNKR